MESDGSAGSCILLVMHILLVIHINYNYLTIACKITKQYVHTCKNMIIMDNGTNFTEVNFSKAVM